MAIKKFGESENIGTASRNAESMFTPFGDSQDPKTRALGEKVYDASKPESNEPVTNPGEFMEVLLGEAELAVSTIQDLLSLYSRAIANPSRTNILRFASAIEEVASDSKKSKTIISVLVSVVYNTPGAR